MNSSRIVYRPHKGADTDGEAHALAVVYWFIFNCRAKKMAAEPAPEPDGRNAEGSSNDGAKSILHD